MRSVKISLAVLLMLAGCVQQPGAQPPQTTAFQSAPMNTEFREEDFAWSAQKGTAVVRGEAFLKTVGGDVKTCAGNTVYLIADNAYSQEAASMVAAKVKPIRDPRYLSYRRQTICDAQGKFEFSDLPTGSWSVLAEVRWQSVTSTGPVTQGGALRRRFDIAEGDQKRFILSSGDMHSTYQ